MEAPVLEQLMGEQGGAFLLFHLDWKETPWRSTVMGLPAQPPLHPQHSLQIPNSPQNFEAERQFCNIYPGA